MRAPKRVITFCDMKDNANEATYIESRVRQPVIVPMEIREKRGMWVPFTA